MRTQSEIKKNNIRKANLLKEYNHRNNKGNVTTKFGLYEDCHIGGHGERDTDGVYMGAPQGTEPMMDMMMGDDMDMMMGDDMGMMMGDDMGVCPDCGRELCDCGGDSMSMGYMGDEDDMPMDDEMMMMMMEKKNAKPDFLDLDGDGDKTEPMKKAAKDKMDEKCGGGYGKDLEEGCGDYKKMDTSDRGEFDGRTSRVVGVDVDDNDLDDMFENYKAVSAKPTRDSWGNKFNNILTESRQVNGINSLMNRMKKVIR